MEQQTQDIVPDVEETDDSKETELPKALEEAQLDEKESVEVKDDSKMEEEVTEAAPETNNKANEETQAAFESKKFDPYNFFQTVEEHNKDLPEMTEEEIAFHEINNELKKCFCKNQKVGKFIGKYNETIQDTIISALRLKRFKVEFDPEENRKKLQIIIS